MKYSLAVVLMLLSGLSVHAQRRIVVIDAETLAPIADVSVRTDSNLAVRTDRHGVAVVPEVFDSIVFSHLKYGREHLVHSEVSDTMVMFSRAQMLQEVVVTALGPDLRRAIRATHERIASQPRPSSLLSFDLADILDRRTRRDRKHLRKAKEIIQELDNPK